MIHQLPPALALLLATACLDFEKQTLTYRYYPKADTLVIAQNYEGIHGTENDQTLSKKELEQLGSVLQGQRTFFFSNWILEYNAAEVRKAIESKGDEQLNDRTRALLKKLLASVKVENGPFYLNKAGQLCAIQRVNIRNFRQMLGEMNAIFRDEIKAGNLPDGVDNKTRKLLLAHAQAGKDFLTIDRNQLKLKIPMSAKDFQDDFFNGDNPVAPYLMKLGGQLAHADNRMNLTFGTPKTRDVTLRLALPDKNYRPNAMGPVRAQNKILKKLDTAKFTKEFLADTDQKLGPQR